MQVRLRVQIGDGSRDEWSEIGKSGDHRAADSKRSNPQVAEASTYRILLFRKPSFLFQKSATSLFAFPGAWESFSPKAVRVRPSPPKYALNIDNMHILLTGAAGSVGGATLRYLLAQGHRVTAIDIIAIPPALLVGIEKQAQSNLSAHILDLASFSALDAIIEAATPSIDGAIHIGGIPNPLNHDPRVTYGVNVTTNYNILQTCAKYGINRIVQASSVNAYGLSFTPPGHKHFDELPISEKTTPKPVR